MQAAIAKFQKRLSLPVGWQSTVRSCIENPNKETQKLFVAKARGRRVLELFHVSRDKDPHEALTSVMNEGFQEASYTNNKGRGVYFANHSRYALTWVGPRSPVLVCHIIAETEAVQRYRSEMHSPTWNSEYVVTDRSLIYPAYLLEWEYTRPQDDNPCDWWEKYNIGYTQKGLVDCIRCQMVNRHGYYPRCDCPYETLDERDCITTYT